jgi:D-glycero-D-manno-heptose 1,7-bisphosphate phosphatase
VALSSAVFLDKDGTLVEDVPYSVEPGLIRLAPGAGWALAALKQSGFKLILVSNQSGLARGYFEVKELEAVWARLQELLEPFSATLDGFYYCPHHPEGSVARWTRACSCRKPEPGLLLQAAAAHGIDLTSSWMVGDILDDVEAGCRAGCRTVFVDRGHETEWKQGSCRTPDRTVGGLEAAAEAVLTAAPTPQPAA